VCSEYTYRPYRVLPQDSTSVSTCRFIESSKLTGDGYAKDFDVGKSLNVCCVYTVHQTGKCRRCCCDFPRHFSLPVFKIFPLV